MTGTPEILSAMTTPFVEGRVDLTVLQAQLRHVEPFSDGVFLPGTTGEFLALSLDEYREVLGTAVEQLGPDRVVAHIGAPGLDPSIERLEAALELGITRCSALTPYYFAVSAGTILDFYRSLVAHAAGRTEIYAYVFPDVTGNDLGPDLVPQLESAGVAGVKVSGAASARVAEYCAKASASFKVWSGNDADLPNILASGGRGTVSGVSGVLPHLWAGYRDACAARDDAAVERAQTDIADAVALIGPSVARHKFAATCAGLPQAEMRMTIDPIPEDVKGRIREVVARLATHAAA